VTTDRHPTPPAPLAGDSQRFLVRCMWASVAAAIFTIVLKSLAAALTGSVGFLSDALESGVNLVAAIVALVALRVAARPPDADHHFGHGKAEYVSALTEGAMIFVAAGAIVWTAVGRLIDPVELEQPALGLVLSTVASLANLGVGLFLVRAGREHRSITLVADGKHLLTDVWTSVGVLVGIALVALTGWQTLDPLVALAVGVNILVTGYGLVRRSLSGLLSGALPPEDQARVDEVLDRLRGQHEMHVVSTRTVESGRQRFVFLEITVPEDWSVRRAHDLADLVEAEVGSALPGCTTFIHVEPSPALASGA
jgi:cation diffusion facilitator family transporter